MMEAKTGSKVWCVPFEDPDSVYYGEVAHKYDNIQGKVEYTIKPQGEVYIEILTATWPRIFRSKAGALRYVLKRQWKNATIQMRPCGKLRSALRSWKGSLKTNQL